jgi:hypothetical protein
LAVKAPSPLGVLVKTMHQRLRKGKEEEAAALAKLAAPFVTALSASRSEPLNLRALTNEQIYELYAELRVAAAGRTHISE